MVSTTLEVDILHVATEVEYSCLLGFVSSSSEIALIWQTAFGLKEKGTPNVKERIELVLYSITESTFGLKYSLPYEPFTFGVNLIYSTPRNGYVTYPSCLNLK